MIRLEVDGQTYKGWFEVEIERELDSFAQRFSMRYLEKIDGQPWAIRAGTQCVLYWENEVLITGYVNRATMRASADEWMLSVEGRSSTSDLVDSSAVHKTGSWTDRTPSQIANELAKPFGLKVAVKAAGADTTFDRWTLEAEETVHDVFDRICKQRGMLPVTTPDGNASFIRVGEGSSSALPTIAVRSRELVEDDSTRQSEYRIYSSGKGLEKAVVLDSGVQRYRPLIILSDSKGGTSGMQARGEWEKNVRAGRSERLRYILSGVHTEAPGRLIDVLDPVLEVDEQLALASSVIHVDEDDATTTWELTRPEAYSTREYPLKKLTRRKLRRFA